MTERLRPDPMMYMDDPQDMGPNYLNSLQASRYLAKSLHTLAAWRRKSPPHELPFAYSGERAVYKLSDLEDYIMRSTEKKKKK